MSAKLALDINAASWTIKEWKKRTALFYSMHRTTELKVQKNCRCRGKGRTAWTSRDNKYVQGEKKKITELACMSPSCDFESILVFGDMTDCLKYPAQELSYVISPPFATEQR